MKKILKKDLISFNGKDCYELLVEDSLLVKDPCLLCDYRGFDSDDLFDEDVSCHEFHGCDILSDSYFVLLDLKSLIL